MTWCDIKEALRTTNTILIPLGSTEQHGPHLPLETDTLLASKIAEETAKRVNAIMAPPIAFGFSLEHISFSGTITLKPETLMCLIDDVCRSLCNHGFKKIIIVNGHGGNCGLIEAAARRIKQEINVTIALANIWELVTDTLMAQRDSQIGGVTHACEFETSLMLALYPEKVTPYTLPAEIPDLPVHSSMDPCFSGAQVRYIWLTHEFSKSGVLGDPTKASKEKGLLLFKVAVENLSAFISNLSPSDQ